MRKLLTMILILVMCFALAACGGESSEEEETGDSSCTAASIEPGTPFGTFDSVDLDGNKVTDAVFAEKDVTVVNVWATYCGPCLDEMPELGAWSEEMPDNAQVIGIVIDAQEGDEEMAEEARSIAADTKATYTNVMLNDSLADPLKAVEAVPTTFIVDREGNMVCEPIIGAYVDRYKTEVKNYLDSI